MTVMVTHFEHYQCMSYLYMFYRIYVGIWSGDLVIQTEQEVSMTGQ